jgi:hypothetical protein
MLTNNKNRASGHAKKARKCNKCKAPSLPGRRFCSKHAAIADHYTKMPRKVAKTTKRVRELSAIYWTHYPDKVLPDNKLGRLWARYVIRTMGFLPVDRRHEWLNAHAPWMGDHERAWLLLMGPHWYTPQSLGDRLELSFELRTKLGVTTIRPHDLSWSEVQAIHKEQRKMKERARRAANRKRPRAEYLAANSISRTKPWLQFCPPMSRTRWYEEGKPTPPPVPDKYRAQHILNMHARDLSGAHDVPQAPMLKLINLPVPSDRSGSAAKAQGAMSTSTFPVITLNQLLALKGGCHQTLTLAGVIDREAA